MTWQPRRPSTEQLDDAKAVSAILVSESDARLTEVEQLLGVRHRRDLTKVVEIAQGWGVRNLNDFHLVDRELQRSLHRVWKLAPGLRNEATSDPSASTLLDVDRVARTFKVAEQAHRIRTCGERDVLRTLVTPGGGRRFLSHWAGCQAKDCPICQARVRIRRTGEFRRALGWLEYNHPRLRWSEMGLSLPNVSVRVLRNNLIETKKALDKLVRRGFWTPSGWLWRFEAKKAEDGSANGHLHLLTVACECCSAPWELPSGYGLGCQWRGVTGLSNANSWTRPLHPGRVARQYRYFWKPAPLYLDDPNWTFHRAEQLVGVRLFGAAGIIREALSSVRTGRWSGIGRAM